jgi:hypothetical protein
MAGVWLWKRLALPQQTSSGSLPLSIVKSKQEKTRNCSKRWQSKASIFIGKVQKIRSKPKKLY